MSCTEITPLLGRWYDAELDPDGVRRVEQHLAACSACAGEVASWRVVDRLLDVEVDPGELRAAVMAAVRQDTSRGGAWWVRVAAAAIVAAGLGSAGGYLATAPHMGLGGDRTAGVDSSLATLEASFTASSVAGLDSLLEDYHALAAGRGR